MTDPAGAAPDSPIAHDQQKDPAMTAQQPTTTSTPEPPAASEPRPGAGIRAATAVVGGTLAILAITVTAIGQYSLAGARSSTSTQAIPASVTSIEIDNAIGDVRVTATPGAAPSVELRTDALAMNRMSTPTMEFDGTTLAIEVAGRSGPCFAACLGTVTILVELGDLALDELDVASDVGTVAVSDGVRVADISAEASVGDAIVSNAVATRIDASSDVGTVRIDAIETTESITATSNTGDVSVTVPLGIAYRLVATSDVGEVVREVATDPAATHSITATSDVGSVSVTARGR